MVPVLLMRRNYILKKLRRCGAVSPQTAVTFEQAGVFNPRGFPRVTRIMVKRGWLAQIGDRFYLAK
ncbi:hypothetical protein [Acutalibacter caecimuris]|uniref:hypothetical protein n=1 Tax=Acutalibacter caecimuris TaxID=3093657 RepID=UPI002AC8BC0A|nr:hypothetical protein [Acutalibacter sp. M00118]